MSFEPIYYIHCASCKSYSTTTTSSVKCISCAQILNRASSKYFVYFPLRAQLTKSIHDHFNEIVSYDKKFNEASDLIRDVQDGIIYKKVRTNYPNSLILPFTGNTDGARIFKSTIGSLWPLQLIQCFLPPNIRYLYDNIILAAIHAGKMHFLNYSLCFYLYTAQVSFSQESLKCINFSTLC